MVEFAAMKALIQSIIILGIFLPLNGFTGRNISSQPLPVSKVIVRYASGIDFVQEGSWNSEKRVIRYSKLPQINTWVLEVTSDKFSQIVLDLAQDPMVLWVQEEGWVQASEIVPNDPYYQPLQENLRVIGMPDAWVFNRGSENPIAIVDSGIDLDHPDLQAKLWMNVNEVPDNGLDDDENGYIDDVIGWNFVSDTANPQDDNGHGSHVSGIAAAHTNNSVGVAGVAWQNSIMSLKALNNLGIGQASHVATAILYAVDHGAKIINLSLGSIEEQLVIRDAVIYAQENDCLVIAAVGNRVSAVEYPAAQTGVLAVSATTNQDLPASFTNRGPEVDIAAPGVDIFSANQRGGYYISSGTSQSAPHVSGLAALIWSLQPEWSALQVSEVITSTSQDVWIPGKDNLTGWGRIDAQKAMMQALKRYFIPLIIMDQVE